jgi:hypothetical protein
MHNQLILKHVHHVLQDILVKKSNFAHGYNNYTNNTNDYLSTNRNLNSDFVKNASFEFLTGSKEGTLFPIDKVFLNFNTDSRLDTEEITSKSIASIPPSSPLHTNANHHNNGDHDGRSRQACKGWWFNPLLSADAKEDSHQLHNERTKAIVQRGDLEIQAIDIQSYLEDVISTCLKDKLKARASIQDWINSFVQLYNKIPTIKDKQNSTTFMNFSKSYVNTQKALKDALDTLHEPCFFAEQKRILFETTADHIKLLTGLRPLQYPHHFSIDKSLAWIQYEDPLSILNSPPHSWFE